MTDSMDDTDLLDPAEAISEMTRMLTSGGPQQAQVLLSACRACRNRLLYLLDTAQYRGTFNRAVLARLRALPVNHQSHGDLSGPDWRKPEIKWITPARGPRPGSVEEQIKLAGDALRAEIFASLEDRGPLGERDIAEAIGRPGTVVRVQCRDLAGRGELRFDAASGEYALMPQPGSSGRPEGALLLCDIRWNGFTPDPCPDAAVWLQTWQCADGHLVYRRLCDRHDPGLPAEAYPADPMCGFSENGMMCVRPAAMLSRIRIGGTS